MELTGEAADALWDALRDPSHLPPGGEFHRSEAGWCCSHPLPLAQLNTARPERADPDFVAYLSGLYRGRSSRVSARTEIAGLGALLEAQGYRPLGTVERMMHPLQHVAATQHERTIRIARTGEEARTWAAAGARARGEPEGGLDPALPWSSLVHPQSPHRLLWVEADGEIIGVGALQLFRGWGLGLLWGAATATPWRRRGVHHALLRARLDLAQREGLSQVVALAHAAGSRASLQAAGFTAAGGWIRSWERPGPSG